MSRNRFFCVAVAALFVFALSGCKSSNATTPSGLTGPTHLLVK